MGLVINNNLASVNAPRPLNSKTDAAREKSLDKLSSGTENAGVPDDAAPIAASEQSTAASQSAISSLRSVAEKTAAASSDAAIRNHDAAMEMARSTRDDMLRRRDVALAAQASRKPQFALSLLA